MPTSKKIVLAIFVALIGLVLWWSTQKEKSDYPPENSSGTATTLKNSVYGFQIEYPKFGGVKVLNNKEEIQTSGYIPACNPDSSVFCLIYPSETYPNSNFSNGGVSVDILPKETTEKQCYTAVPSGLPSKEETVSINGIIFKKYGAGDAAAGHQSNGFNYRIYRNKACYELTSRINTTTFENYAPGMIQRFTDAQKQELETKLKSIIESFKFTPVL